VLRGGFWVTTPPPFKHKKTATKKNENMKILIAEDERDVASAYRIVLEETMSSWLLIMLKPLINIGTMKKNLTTKWED
jgi:peroxiredoxin